MRTEYQKFIYPYDVCKFIDLLQETESELVSITSDSSGFYVFYKE